MHWRRQAFAITGADMSMGRSADRPALCPNCATGLAGAATEPPWCPACEWNLAASPRHGGGRLGRSDFAADQRMFEQLVGAPPRRPRWSVGVLTVLAISVLLAALLASILVLGVLLVVTGSWPIKIVGVAMIGVAFELRPRLPYVEVAPGYTTRSDAPALFDVIDIVAAQVGCPPIDVVVLDGEFDASCARLGLRRRRVLVLGVPLWAALGPAGRVALLAHQLAHFVDGDPEQRLVFQPALSTVGTLADSFARHGRVLPDFETPGARDGGITAGQYSAILTHKPSRNTLESMSAGLSAVAFAPLHWLFATAHRWLRTLTARSRKRAEYYADALAADVAGSVGMAEYCRTLLLHEAVFNTTRRWLRVGADMQTVQQEAADTIARHADDMALREQRSLRTDSSRLAGHPPIGRRLRLLRSRPPAAGRLPADTLDLAAADTELDRDYRRVARALAHTA
jgi:heat shock protein HtpX